MSSTASTTELKAVPAPVGDYEMLPVHGPHAPEIRPQVRPADSDALTREGLDDLIWSIERDGVLQPVEVERHPDGTLVLLYGQRRLRAVQIGVEEGIDSPHFNGFIPAIVRDATLSERDRDRVQVVENEKRAGLTATEKGRLLWRERYRTIVERVRANGHEPPNLDDIDDWADKTTALLEWKKGVAGLGQVGASFEECASLCGLDLSESVAKSYAKQYRDLGSELSERADGFEASGRARNAMRDVAGEFGTDTANALLDAVEGAADGTLAKDSRAVEEVMKARVEHPDLPVADIVNSVVTERLAALSPGSRDTAVNAEDGGVAIGNIHVHTGDNDRAGVPQARNGGSGMSEHDMEVDLSGAIRRLKEVESDLNGKVGPHLDHIVAEAAKGRRVDDEDARLLAECGAMLMRWADKVTEAAASQ